MEKNGKLALERHGRIDGARFSLLIRWLLRDDVS
jgi:hypothetical protein